VFIVLWATHFYYPSTPSFGSLLRSLRFFFFLDSSRLLHVCVCLSLSLSLSVPSAARAWLQVINTCSSLLVAHAFSSLNLRYFFGSLLCSLHLFFFLDSSRLLHVCVSLSVPCSYLRMAPHVCSVLIVLVLAHALTFSSSTSSVRCFVHFTFRFIS
jgi:hypothetical protein